MERNTRVHIILGMGCVLVVAGICVASHMSTLPDIAPVSYATSQENMTEEPIQRAPRPVIDNWESPDIIEQYQAPEIPQEDVDMIARTIWGEARGVSDWHEQAAVGWCIINRLQNGSYGSTISEVVTMPGAFAGYDPDNPLLGKFQQMAYHALLTAAMFDSEHRGAEALPSEYLYFSSADNGRYNRFRTTYRSSDPDCKFWN